MHETRDGSSVPAVPAGGTRRVLVVTRDAARAAGHPSRVREHVRVVPGCNYRVSERGEDRRVPGAGGRAARHGAADADRRAGLPRGPAPRWAVLPLTSSIAPG